MRDVDLPAVEIVPPSAGQGQSLATIDKERCIGSALSLGMQVAASKLSRYTFWHFDANSGCGWNDKVDVAGSPLVFWALADQRMPHMDVRAFFADWHRPSMDSLLERLKPMGRAEARSYLLPGDNAEGIEVFAEAIRQSGDRPQFAVGSLIVDPNGYFYRNQKGEGAPVEQVLAFAREFPRIDIILNLNVRTYRLQKSQGHALLMPREIFAALDKKHWLVRRTHCGRDEFMLAIGRNFPTGEHKGLGMHGLSTEAGQHVISLAEGRRQEALL